MIVVQAGAIEQWLEGEKTVLGPGEAVFIGMGTVHASFNTGQETARLTVALGPCAGEEATSWWTSPARSRGGRCVRRERRDPQDRDARADLRDLVGSDAVVADADLLERYAADTYWKALAARGRGTPLGLPDVAVLPADEAGVARASLRQRARPSGRPAAARLGKPGGAVPVGAASSSTSRASTASSRWTRSR